MHFWRDASEGQRLTQAWNKEFPVPVAPDVLTSSNPSSPKKTSAKVTQLTQDSIDNPEDDDPAKLMDEKSPKINRILLRRTWVTMCLSIVSCLMKLTATKSM